MWPTRWTAAIKKAKDLCGYWMQLQPVNDHISSCKRGTFMHRTFHLHGLWLCKYHVSWTDTKVWLVLSSDTRSDKVITGGGVMPSSLRDLKGQISNSSSHPHKNVLWDIFSTEKVRYGTDGIFFLCEPFRNSCILCKAGIRLISSKAWCRARIQYQKDTNNDDDDADCKRHRHCKTRNTGDSIFQNLYPLQLILCHIWAQLTRYNQPVSHKRTSGSKWYQFWWLKYGRGIQGDSSSMMKREGEIGWFRNWQIDRWGGGEGLVKTGQNCCR